MNHVYYFMLILSLGMFFGDTSKYHRQPFGPRMCEHVCQLRNCSSVLFTAEHLSCQVFENRNTFGTFEKNITNLIPTPSRIWSEESNVHDHRKGKRNRTLADGNDTGRIKTYREGRTWDEAQGVCQKDGGSLVKIGNREKKNLFEGSSDSHFAAVRMKSVWIGLKDLHDNDTFFWVDGTPLNFSNWAPGEPDSLYKTEKGFVKENCGTLVMSLTYWAWYSASCGIRIPFVCDIKLSAVL